MSSGPPDPKAHACSGISVGPKPGQAPGSAGGFQKLLLSGPWVLRATLRREGQTPVLIKSDADDTDSDRVEETAPFLVHHWLLRPSALL